MPIVAVSMSDTDLVDLNSLQAKGGFSNRSEVVRHAIQSLLAEHRTLEGYTGNVTVIVTVVYAEDGKGKDCQNVQHRHSQMITTMVHSHTGDGGCIEVLIVNGDAKDVRRFIKALRANRSVSRVKASVVGS